MSKKRKRKSRPNQAQVTISRSDSSRSSLDNFNPDYTYVMKDLRTIGILAGIFIAILVILSLFLG
jgi:hypothetical protein